MASRTAWLVNDSMSGEDMRLALGAALIHDTALRVRSAVIPAPGNPLAVAIATGMNVTVQTGQAVIGGARGAAQGMYVHTEDAVRTITLDAGDPAQPRIDVILIRVRDTGYSDSGLDGGIVVVKGSPNASPVVPTYSGTAPLGTGYALATVRVPAGASVGSGGLTAAGAILTDLRSYAAAIGGAVVVPSQAAENALAQYPSMRVFRSDLAGGLRDRVSDGTTFATLDPIGRVTSVKKTSISGVTFSDAVVPGMSVTFAAIAGRRYRVSYKVAAYDTSGVCGVQFKLRDAGAGSLTTASPQLDLCLVDAGINGVVGFNQGVYEYVPGSSGTKTLGLTCLAITATSGVNVYAAADAPMSIIVEDIGA